MADQDLRSLPPARDAEEVPAWLRRTHVEAGQGCPRPTGAPLIELLWWDGCPSHPEALALLRAAVAELGVAPEAVVSRELRTDDEADTERFAGSPTIRVDGRDLFPPADEPTGLTCRVYRLRDGRSSPTPDPDDLRDALRAALKEHA